MTNEERARYAGEAVDAFVKASRGEPVDLVGRWQVAGDLICDLMHWLDRDPDVGEPVVHSEAIIDRALMHYREEREEPKTNA